MIEVLKTCGLLVALILMGVCALLILGVAVAWVGVWIVLLGKVGVFVLDVLRGWL